MLTKLELENFKSWKKAQIELAPLTAFFGANSSGKSSLIQFLLLLKQTKESSDRSLALDFGTRDFGTRGSYVDCGSFKNAIYRHMEDAHLKWQLRWNQQEKLDIADPDGRRSTPILTGTEFAISAGVSLRNKEPSCDKLNYSFSDQSFSLVRRGDTTEFKLEASGYKFKRTTGRAWKLPGPVKSYAFPDQVRTYFQNSLFLSDLENAYESQINNIYHLGPLREDPKREYTWGGSSPLNVGPRGEYVVDAIMSATARKEKRNLRAKGHHMPFQEMIAEWLKRMNLIELFNVEEVGKETGLYRVRVQKDSKSASTFITDVGFGVSQILPVLVLLYYVPEGSTVLLEQPEIHLHPSVQAALADLIITVVKHRKIQVIVESHSEHLLHRLTRRIAEGDKSPYPKISPQDVSLYFSTMKEGTSRLERLKINLFGHIENWPKDFFGDAFGDIAARDKAALKRMIEE